MNSMRSSPSCSLKITLFCLVTVLFGSAIGFAAAPVGADKAAVAAATQVFYFDLPAADAAVSFRRFHEISGMELLYASELVQNVRTAPTRGEFTAREALQRMLANTDLVVAVEPGSGALVVKRNSPQSATRNMLPVVEVRPPDRSYYVTSTGEELEELEPFRVTGSRLLFNSGDIPTQPLQIYTSDYIERLGATSLGQVFQFIPSITSYSTGLIVENVNATSSSGIASGQTQSRTSAQLRGGSQNETLLLIDGRRVPLTGLRNSGGNGYDLGSLPLAAIERIEVLLDGASAIYGADAVNGVINVILKKSYSGTQVRYTYDNTFDKDAAYQTLSLTHGFAAGKLSGMLTLSASENNIMLLTDRRLTSTFDRRVFGGTLDQSQPNLFI